LTIGKYALPTDFGCIPMNLLVDNSSFSYSDCDIEANLISVRAYLLWEATKI